MIASTTSRVITPTIFEPNFTDEGNPIVPSAVSNTAPLSVNRSTIGGFNIIRQSGGQAMIDLGSGYSLSIDDTDRQVIFENRKSQLRTVIYGNAKIGIESSRAAEVPILAILPVSSPPIVTPMLPAAQPAPLPLLSAELAPSVLPLAVEPAAVIPEVMVGPTVVALVPDIVALPLIEPDALPTVLATQQAVRPIEPIVTAEQNIIGPQHPLAEPDAAVSFAVDPVPLAVIASVSEFGFVTAPMIASTSASLAIEQIATLSETITQTAVPVIPPAVETPAAIVAPPLDLWQFWGTTSFVFGDDQKITLETAPRADGSSGHWLDRITVTSNTNGVVINGVADETTGDIKIEAVDGYTADEETRDGLTLEEQPDSSGWQDEDGVALDQAVLDATALGADFGPGSTLMSRSEITTVLNRIFAYGFVSSLMSSMSVVQSRLDPPSDIRNDLEKSSDRRRVERFVVEQILAQQASEARRIETGNFALAG
jgi:Domain of Unknown Function (DUF1521)